MNSYFCTRAPGSGSAAMPRATRGDELDGDRDAGGKVAQPAEWPSLRRLVDARVVRTGGDRSPSGVTRSTEADPAATGTTAVPPTRPGGPGLGRRRPPAWLLRLSTRRHLRVPGVVRGRSAAAQAWNVGVLTTCLSRRSCSAATTSSTTAAVSPPPDLSRCISRVPSTVAPGLQNPEPVGPDGFCQAVAARSGPRAAHHDQGPDPLAGRLAESGSCSLPGATSKPDDVPRAVPGGFTGLPRVAGVDPVGARRRWA